MLSQETKIGIQPKLTGSMYIIPHLETVAGDATCQLSNRLQRNRKEEKENNLGHLQVHRLED